MPLADCRLSPFLFAFRRLNSLAALTPLNLHPHRLKEFHKSQATVALEFLFSWDFDLTTMPRVKSAKLVGPECVLSRRSLRRRLLRGLCGLHAFAGLRVVSLGGESG